VAWWLLAAGLTVAVVLGAGGTAFAARVVAADDWDSGTAADDGALEADPSPVRPPLELSGDGGAAGSPSGSSIVGWDPGPTAPTTGTYAQEDVQIIPEELRASAYVEEARHGFRGSPAGFRFFGPVPVRAPLPGQYGRHANATGRPIGGGSLYGDWVAPPPEGFVRTFAELASALDTHLAAVMQAIAQDTPIPRRTIFVAGDAAIELGEATLSLAPGLTLASARGRDGAPGGLLKSSSHSGGPAFIVTSRVALGPTPSGTPRPLPPVRITRLRLQGPNPYETSPDFWDCSANGRSAIEAFEDRHREAEANIVDRVVEIDNNEFSAWPAVTIGLNGIRGGFVHHNSIHHSQLNPQEHFQCWLQPWEGFHALGYGVHVNNGRVYIEANLFAHTRHAIASRGDQFTDYIAMYNVLGEDGPSHHFDVHGGEDRDDGTHIAGRHIVIAYNTDYGDDEDAVNIRGNPTGGVYITGNQFRGDPDSIRQTKTGAGLGLSVWDNQFGTSWLDSGGGGPGPCWQCGGGSPIQQK
jgi:hypothetical protein